MATADIDNVITLQTGATSEPQPGPSGRSKDSTSALRAKRYRRARKQGGKRDGRATARQPNRDGEPAPVGQAPQDEKNNEIKPSVTVHVAPPLAPSADAWARHGAAADVVAYMAAIALAGAAAWFSVRGMVVLFPGSPNSVIAMAVAMEAAKLITAGWLARRWRATALIWRAALVAFVFGLAVINAAGVYAQLVSAHVGDRGAATSRIEEQTADLEAKISVQAHTVADLDRRLAQIDTAVEKATEKGRTTAAMKLADDQRKARAGLVDERKREAGTLAALQAERASVAANGRRIETEAAPIRYVAELLGVDTDSEKAIRWLIALMVLCCDPLAIALTAAASARR
jgi:uncharacterized coiled-coil protein SlyX